MKFTGIVEEGDQIARHYGCPTANIWHDGGLSCNEGTYASIVEYGDRTFEAATYCVNEGSGCRIEAHLFNFKGKLVGKKLTVKLVQHVSGVTPFVGETQMQKKIDRDLAAVRAYFETISAEESASESTGTQLLGA